MNNILSVFESNLGFLLGKNYPKSIAVAVSGGCDSVAMLFLALAWAKARSISLTVLSVNHNLRKEASDELNYVKELANSLEVDFVGLSWQPGDKENNLQARAREGRYDLMCRVCRDRNIRTLLTAHHKDDFMENYLIRESRNSSILGLSSSYSFFYNNTQILRPLFNLTKENLIHYLVRHNIIWFEDNSNQLEKYQRNRIRHQLSLISTYEKEEIERKIEETNKKAEILGQQLIRAIAETCFINNFGFVFLDLTKFVQLEQNIKVQLIAYIITVASGSSLLPRYRTTEKLLSKIASGQPINNNIHNCIIRTTGSKLLIYKEISKIPLLVLPLLKFTRWDNRFDLIINEKPQEKMFVTKLNALEYKQIKGKIDLTQLAKSSNNNHTNILFTLPIVKNLEKIVAIPHISYYDNNQIKQVKVIFKPNFISRFTHFF